MTFTNRHLIPEDISTENPVSVTITDHGLSTGQFVRAAGFVVIPKPVATGMEQLNNRLFKVRVISSSIFQLYDTQGNQVNGTSYTPFTGDGTPLFTLTGPDLFVQNTA